MLQNKSDMQDRQIIQKSIIFKHKIARVVIEGSSTALLTVFSWLRVSQSIHQVEVAVWVAIISLLGFNLTSE